MTKSKANVVKQNMRSSVLFVAGAIALILIVIVCLIVYLNSEAVRAKEEAYDNLAMVSDTLTEYVKDTVSDDFLVLNTYVKSKPISGPENRSEDMANMKAICDATVFKRIWVIDPAGNGFSQDGTTAGFFARSYFQRAMAGETCLERVANSVVDNTVYYILAVPMHDSKGNVSGVLTGSISEDDFRAMLDTGVANDGSYSFVCYSTGHIIISTLSGGGYVEGRNIIQAVSASDHLGVTAKKTFAENLNNQKSGSISYSVDGTQRFAVYSPLGINNWYLFNVVPSKNVDASVADATRSGIQTIIIVILVFIALIAMILIVTGVQNRRLKSEYKRVRLSDERFRLALDSTNVSIWDYDIKNHRILQTENSMRLHGNERVVENVPDGLIAEGYIHPESAEACRELYKKLEGGDRRAEAVLRARRPDGSGYWYEHVRYTSLMGVGGRPVRAIGVSEDVTEKYEAKANYEREIRLQQVLAPNVYLTALFDVSEGRIVKTQFKSAEEGSIFIDATFANYFSISAERVRDDDSVKSFLRGISAPYLRERFDQKDDSFGFDYILIMGSGEERWVHEELHLMPDPDTGNLMLFLCVKDVDKEKKRIDRLSLAAECDAMTGLLNHEITLRRISEYLESEGFGGSHALFMVDIDFFKEVNDTVGHQAGDNVIGMVSSGIKGLFRSDDIIGRMGGDEFLVLMKNVPSVDVVRQKSAELVDGLQFTCTGDGNSINITASIGAIMFVSDGGKTVPELYKAVDDALYTAKAGGRSKYHLSTDDEGISGGAFESSQTDKATTIQLQAIMENIDGAVFVVEIGETLQPLYISPSFFKTAGPDEAEAVKSGVSITTFIHPDEVEQFESECRKYAASGEPWDYTYRVLLSDGKIGWRHGRAVTIPYEGSPNPVMIDIVTDVTEIMQTSNKLDAILNNSPVGIAQFTLGKKAAVTFVNNEFVRMCGVSREEFDRISGTDLTGILTDDERSSVVQQLNSVEKPNDVLEYIHKYLHPADGSTHYFSVRSILLNFNGDGEKAFLSIVTDVTKQVRLEAELAESRHPSCNVPEIGLDGGEKKPVVLVVDDSAPNRRILRHIISDSYVVLEAENGFEALGILRRRLSEFSAVLLDLVMPVMDGFQFLDDVNRDESLRDIPIIVVTGNSDPETETSVLRAGAWDYIVKPLNPDIVKFRLKNVILRSKMTAFSRLKYLAEFDELTGIYNRRQFFSATREMLLLNRDHKFALIRFDINHFGLVNTYYGIEEGDKVLKFLAGKMKKAAKIIEKRTFGRIESDVFGVCIQYTDIAQLEGFFATTKRLLDEYGLDFDLVPTFGVYLIDDPEMDVEQMFDYACLAAKGCKGNYLKNYSFYGEAMSEAMLKEQQIVNKMNSALEQGQFEVYLQPKVNIFSETTEGAEALVRWNDPERGIVPPGEFIPIFECNGFITKMDFYVWEQTCRILRRWIDEGKNVLPISVNVSRVNLFNSHLPDTICSLTDKYDVPRRYFNIELTESSYMDNQEAMSRVIRELRDRGYTVMMDDFGSGFSSLNALKDIIVDVLKIDQRFLTDNGDLDRGRYIIQTVVELAEELHMEVIAEGVEEKEQVEFLKSIGCSYVQGYYFAKPMPVSEFEKRMEQ